MVTVSVCSLGTMLIHGSWFGWSFLKIPAIDPSIRFLNSCIDRTPKPALREGLSTAELIRLLNILIRLPRKNGRIGAVMAFLIIVACSVQLVNQGAPLFQLSLMWAVGAMALLLHGSVTAILSELAISRIVSKCREAILREKPDFKMSASSSMNGKFLILGQAFLMALIGKRKDDADPLRRRQRVVNIRFAGRGGLEAVKAWIAKNF